jgi:predicted P-loop ATPase
VVSTPKPASAYGTTLFWADYNLTLTNSGTPHANMDNVVRILEKHRDLQGRIWWDDFEQRVYSTWLSDAPYEWSDEHDSKLSLWIQRTACIPSVKTSAVSEAVTVYAHHNRRNSCRDWLESLSWDGTPRLSSLMHTTFGTPDDEYHAAVGRCWLVSMAMRVLYPGCKSDYMPVFEGAQGIRKSTAMSALGGRWFAEAAESPLSKDFHLALTGKMLVEIAEMDSFSKADIDKVKQVVSCASDRYRKPYGRRAEDHPRSCVFAGTVNRSDWNRDETGARRFWPIACKFANVEWLLENRDQIFAEAVHRAREGEAYWDVPIEEAKRQQEARRSHDEWEGKIAQFLLGKAEAKVTDILSDCLCVPIDRQDKSTQMRVAKALTTLGWERRIAWRDGCTTRIWVDPKCLFE